eukprot:1156503-Pelagomonas_calceolata.AAC.8
MWISLLLAAHPDDRSKGCKLSDLDRVFLATNLEEGKSEADKINLDNSLMRFEFLEGILRVTVVKASPFFSLISRCLYGAFAMEQWMPLQCICNKSLDAFTVHLQWSSGCPYGAFAMKQ